MWGHVWRKRIGVYPYCNKTTSPVALEPLPFPQGNNIIMTLCWLNEAGEGLTDVVLLEWALDMLHSPEDWRWLWNPEPATTPSSSLTQNPPPQLWYSVSNVNLLSMYIPNAQSTNVPSVALPLLDTPNAPASCDPAPSVESSVMWAPVAQLQLWLTHPLSLPEWVTLEGFESVSQGYDRG